jgi:mono/diheme cytochrome c family protein
MRRVAVLILWAWSNVAAHDAHGRSNAPLEARRLRSPLANTRADMQTGQALYETHCTGCHGADGKARTPLGDACLSVRPISPTT